MLVGDCDSSNIYKIDGIVGQIIELCLKSCQRLCVMLSHMQHAQSLSFKTYFSNRHMLQSSQHCLLCESL